MVTYCTICSNNCRKTKHISFFCYPKDTARRNQWLKIVGREDLIPKMIDYNTRQRYRICEDHFEKHYIKYSRNHTKKFFHDHAVPTLNLPPNSGGNLSRCETVSRQHNQDIQIVPDELGTRSTIVKDVLVAEGESYSIQDLAEDQPTCSELLVENAHEPYVDIECTIKEDISEPPDKKLIIGPECQKLELAKRSENKSSRVNANKPLTGITVENRSSIEMFFDCMASTIDAFPLKKQIIAKKRVFDIISQMEMELIDEEI